MTDLNINNLTDSPNADLEIARRGQFFYENAIRSEVEIPDNLGKIISIDIETGNYAIDDNLLDSSRRLQQQYPHAIIWAERIGFNAVYAVGGTLTKVDLS
jgi:hypothetical protein